MKIETTPREDHQVAMTVELEEEQLERAKKRSARQLAKRGKIAGFRPGKAPYDVIRRQFGDEAILEGAIDILLDDIYPKALDEAKLKPSGSGALENVEMEPPTFTFVVPLKPEVDLGDYREIRMAYKYKKPGDAEIDAKLEELQKMYATTAEVKRPVEEGDFIKADIVGKKVGVEGDDAIVYEETNHPIFITAEKREAEEPFVGFAKKLIGMSAGETKTTSKKFSKKHEDENLREATVKYKVTINTVFGTEFPELDDEFAQKLSGGTMAELRETITKDLEAESLTEYDDEYFTALIDKIKESATIKYPPQVLNHEIEAVIEELEQRIKQQGMEFEAYLKMQESTLEEFTEKEARPVAIKRLERGLIFDELARLENIEIQEGDLESEFNQTLMSLASQGYDLNNIKGGKRAQTQIANNIAQQSATQLITRLTLERIKDIATGDFAKAEKAAAEKAEKEATGTEAKSAEEEKEIEVADAPEEEVATEKTEENTAESDE